MSIKRPGVPDRDELTKWIYNKSRPDDALTWDETHPGAERNQWFTIAEAALNYLVHVQESIPRSKAIEEAREEAVADLVEFWHDTVPETLTEFLDEAARPFVQKIEARYLAAFEHEEEPGEG